VRFACNGECPKHRFIRTPDGEPGLNYLCPAYKRIFKHMDPYMRIMAELVRSGRQAAHVMEIVAEQDRQKQWSSVKRNDPCPCGSGKKFKKCCGAPET
ncbi:MAG: SEC-C domain-containing protein, partial [Deltaproteobacteria bacterium]|nr:SEC-C domain-containing protein [Deltaproteobacteria bacterium]